MAVSKHMEKLCGVLSTELNKATDAGMSNEEIIESLLGSVSAVCIANDMSGEEIYHVYAGAAYAYRPSPVVRSLVHKKAAQDAIGA